MPFLSMVRSAWVVKRRLTHAILAFHPEPAALQVGQEATLGLVVGVRNAIAHLGGLSGDLTDSSHGSLLTKDYGAVKPSIIA